MAFVNEYISEVDVDKYEIKALFKKLYIGFHQPCWTVDHERDIHLIYVSNGREDHGDEYTFSFYWKGHVLAVVLKVRGGGEWRGAQWRHYDLLRITLPDEIKLEREHILEDLKEALVAFKSNGFFSNCTTHTATFGF